MIASPANVITIGQVVETDHATAVTPVLLRGVAHAAGHSVGTVTTGVVKTEPRD